MRKKFEFKPERIDDFSYRYRVLGGWMVVTENTKRSAMTSLFVPDRLHQWEVLLPVQEIVPTDLPQS